MTHDGTTIEKILILDFKIKEWSLLNETQEILFYTWSEKHFLLFRMKEVKIS
jgi:hypothetical protein